MQRNEVKTYKYRVGKNSYVIINIYQSAAAHALQGNALASNAVNVQVLKKSKRR